MKGVFKMITATVKNIKPKTVLKNLLHVAVYIVLGLLLAFFINSTAQAAELENPENPPIVESVENVNGEETQSDPPPADYESAPPPLIDPPGKLLLHQRAEGTGMKLSGAVFSLHRTFDNAFIAELITDIFGEAVFDLPAGDYYIRQTAAPLGFITNTDRINFTIQSGLIRELTVISRPEPIITPPLPGRLVIVNRAEGVNASLNGSVFNIFNAMNDHFIAEVVTNHFGEASFELPTGDYYIRQAAVPMGIILNTERIGFRIVSGEIRTVMVMNRVQQTEPPPTTTQPPAVQYGRLIVTLRTDGTRETIQGAAFTVHHSLTDEIVARLTTDRFGESSVQLPVGDYFLRQTSTPNGFIFNTDRIPVRIQGNAVREINVTNRAEPPIADDPPPASGGSGRLLIFKRADGTRELLEGAVFAVHEARFDMQITTLTTNQFGEAAVDLPAGNYYLRQITAPNGFILNNDRINVEIRANETREVTVVSRAEPAAAVPPAAMMGRLLVTVRAQGTGETLQGMYFAVHDGMTDEIIGGRHTDQFGEISIPLPAGDYFLRQMTTIDGFIINTDRIPVRIRDNAVTDISVARAAVPPPTPEPTPAPTQRPAATAAATPTPTQAPPSNEGRIEIITRAAGSGNPLSGGTYAVFRAADHQRIGELTTSAGGMASISAEPGFYYIRELRPTFGFLLETERIFLEVGRGETVKIELTKNRDFNIVDLPADVEGGGFIYITQTGQDMSMFHYTGGGLLLAISFIFGGLALWVFLSKKGRGVLNV